MGINNHNVANGRLRNALFLGFNDLSILLFEHHITATITFFLRITQKDEQLQACFVVSNNEMQQKCLIAQKSE